MRKNLLVTGGCGFIGSNFLDYVKSKDYNLIVVDKLTYCSNIDNIKDIKHTFYKNDIGDSFISDILIKHDIDYVVNFAAETHVDNSISNPDVFIETNIVKTFELIKNCLKYQGIKKDFRFIHISTDEVYGDLEFDAVTKFNEQTRYDPSSPYSSSKAAIDLIINSYIRTFDFNAIILHCTNNFGPYQFTEKLIPKTIDNCLKNKSIPVYGTGKNIRDWIYVEDFCRGIYLAMTRGKLGEHYCFGGMQEITNLEVVETICTLVSEKLGKDFKSLITFVEDRKGHDKRYAVDFSKSKKELGFEPKISLLDGLKIIINNI